MHPADAGNDRSAGVAASGDRSQPGVGYLSRGTAPTVQAAAAAPAGLSITTDQDGDNAWRSR
jgi:hypothetical protein